MHDCQCVYISSVSPSQNHNRPRQLLDCKREDSINSLITLPSGLDSANRCQSFDRSDSIGIAYIPAAPMKQKIVIQVSMSCEKTRVTAMQVAAGRTGVISVQIAGDGRNRLEVVGVDVDPVCLVCCLRKKLGHAQILLVEEVKDKKPEEEKPEEKKPEEKKPPCYYDYYYHHRPPMVVDCGQPSGIMYPGGYW